MFTDPPPHHKPRCTAFSSIKAFLQCSWQEKTLSIIDQACHNITPSKAAGYFKASGYIV
ncbi:hypothetical protein PILCRDRAFT_75654 [Piloderma croceum F 1598]|uniref:Uncharacterized protein n=1 Tax=Piloderma croceum (strain F 1598) TaxID=765440 RepID=A0A0C3FEA1_PILCF|nr:hypothetical protein PILCRDRAFT_75654 [Piloderma croceum F 1598]